MEEYGQIRKRLTEDTTRTLYIHILAGHGVQKDYMQALLINEHDQWAKVSSRFGKMRYIDYNNFYKRFEAEKLVKDLANDFPHSYHLAIFVCGREFEKRNY